MAQQQLMMPPLVTISDSKVVTEPKKRKSTTPSPKTSKKLRMDTHLMEAARRIARYSRDDLESLNKLTPLADMAPGTVLEVVKAETRTSVHGRMAVLTCFTDDSRKTPTTIMAPERVYKEGDTFPAIYAYFGKRETKSRAKGVVHAHKIVRLAEEIDEDEVAARAKDLRRLSVAELEKAMGSVASFRDFPRGTIIVIDGFRTTRYEEQDSIIAKYTSVMKGDEESDREGEIYLPTRLRDDVTACKGRAIVVYKGLSVTKEGLEYFDVTIIPEGDAEHY